MEVRSIVFISPESYSSYTHGISGLLIRMYERHLPPLVHGGAAIQACDIPASRKFSGSAGHSHKKHPCNVCEATQADFNDPEFYKEASE